MSICRFCLMTLLVLRACCNVSPVSPYGESESGISVLYEGGTALPASTPQTLTITFSATKTNVPLVGLSIMSYKEVSDVNPNYVKVQQNSVSQTDLAIQVNSTVATIFKVKVSYMAIDNLYANVQSFFLEKFPSDFTNISSGSGPRLETIIQTIIFLPGGQELNADNSQNTMSAYLVGYSLTTSNTLSLRTEASVTNSISLAIRISVDGDCTVDYLYYNLILIDKAPWEGSNVNFFDTLYSPVENSTYVFNFTYEHLSARYFLIGLNGLEASVGGTVEISFDFDVDPAGTGFSIVSSANLQTLDIRILFLSILQCPAQFPYYKSNELVCTNVCLRAQTTAPANNVCQPCISPCFFCITSAHECSICVSGYELQPDNTCVPSEPSDTSPTESSTGFPIWVVGVIAPVFLVLVIGVCIYCRRPPRVLFEDDIRMHPSIDIL